MGLFQKKPIKTDKADNQALEQRFFDDNFREELRNHGRWYFAKVIKENGVLFKRDLDITISQLKSELHDQINSQLDSALAEIKSELNAHVKSSLDSQLEEFNRTVKNAQDSALMAMTDSTNNLARQHKELSEKLQHSLAEQEKMLGDVTEENKSKITAIADAQTAALQWINHSAQSLQEHDQQLTALLEKTLVDQRNMLIKSFETNMAKIIEHYLVEAVGEQYDLKSQLPAIIEHLEKNKQAIVDDMAL